MSAQTSPQVTERLANLRALAKAREGRPGYTDNVKEIKDEIARLEREQDNG